MGCSETDGLSHLGRNPMSPTKKTTRPRRGSPKMLTEAGGFKVCVTGSSGVLNSYEICQFDASSSLFAKVAALPCRLPGPEGLCKRAFGVIFGAGQVAS